MGDFRKVVIVLAALTMLAGLASAQGTFSCTATVSVPTSIRNEGITEQVGDIVLVCSGGTPLAGTVPTNYANIQVFLTAPITSRLMNTGSATTLNSAFASEAMLLMDEPAAAAQVLCSNNVAGAQVAVVGNCPATYTPATGLVSPNVYQGVLSAATSQSVTFFGVPIVPPASAGQSRIYRITNVRVSGASAGGTATVPSPVNASVSISGSVSVPVSNPQQIVAYSQPGLAASLRASTTSTSTSDFSGITALKQCVSLNDGSGTKSGLLFLRYAERFGSAFKTRTAAGLTVAPTPSCGTGQNCTNQVFNNSESGFVWDVTKGGTLVAGQYVAGLADSGTRFKAVFNNVPNGIRIYVATVNTVANPANTSGSTGSTPASTVAPTVTGTLNTQTVAQLIATTAGGEAIGDYSGLPSVTASTSDTIINVTTPTVELPVINGQAVAVWEVINSVPSAIEYFDFPVAVRYATSVATNSPAPGIGTVNLSLAPVSTSGAASLGGVAPIPRFSDTSTATSIFQVSACRTILLFPFVTNQVGFDTGLAIANTSTDPFATTPQAGACVLNAYGASAPSQPINTPSVASGTVYTTLASTAMPGFQGYVIATCNFQYAHGFAFISDVGARNLAMGYLALIVPDPATGSRTAGGITTGNNGYEVLGF